MKSKQIGTQQQRWRQCHIFWACVKLRLCWDDIIRMAEGTLNHEVPRDPRILFLGLIPEAFIMKEDMYLFKIMTVANKIIMVANGQVLKRHWSGPAWSISDQNYSEGSFSRWQSSRLATLLGIHGSLPLYSESAEISAGFHVLNAKTGQRALFRVGTSAAQLSQHSDSYF